MPSGPALLRDPDLNLSTGSTEAERVLTRLRKPTDPLETFVALNALHDRNGSLFFRVLTCIREVAAHVAAVVADTAYRNGLEGKPKPADALADVRAQMFDPHY